MHTLVRRDTCLLLFVNATPGWFCENAHTWHVLLPFRRYMGKRGRAVCKVHFSVNCRRDVFARFTISVPFLLDCNRKINVAECRTLISTWEMLSFIPLIARIIFLLVHFNRFATLRLLPLIPYSSSFSVPIRSNTRAKRTSTCINDGESLYRVRHYSTIKYAIKSLPLD